MKWWAKLLCFIAGGIAILAMDVFFPSLCGDLAKGIGWILGIIFVYWFLAEAVKAGVKAALSEDRKERERCRDDY